LNSLYIIENKILNLLKDIKVYYSLFIINESNIAYLNESTTTIIHHTSATTTSSSSSTTNEPNEPVVPIGSFAP
jgi:hypothetical protein